MVATTCTVDRTGSIHALSGPWADVLPDVGALIEHGVDAVVPPNSREEFMRTIIRALTDGTASTDHPFDVDGRGRRWLAWSLSVRHDGRLDAVVVDVTRSRASTAWAAASTLAPRLAAVAPDLERARRVLTTSLGRELGGAASIEIDGPGATDAGRRAAFHDRAEIQWPGEGLNGDDCLLVIPLTWPGGHHATVTVTTPFRLDLWLDEIHLLALREEIERALERVDAAERKIEAIARERLFAEGLVRELQQPLDLLDRTLSEARKLPAGQQQHLVEQASVLAARLHRISDIFASATAAPMSEQALPLPLGEVVDSALSAVTDVVPSVDARIDATTTVVAQRVMLIRALTVLLHLTDEGHVPRLEAATRGNVVGLRITLWPATGIDLTADAGARHLGLQLTGALVGAAGGRLSTPPDSASVLLMLPTQAAPVRG